jgi:amidohydrolase
MPHTRGYRTTGTLLLALGLVAPAGARAQETPTERQAAREVLQTLDALERSLDVPALVARLTGPNPERERVVARAKALMETELLALSDEITRNPEIGFQEHRSIAKLIDYLKRHDFTVEVGVAGLETAFVARWKGNSGPPNLGVIVEYDALRGTERPFHGDQHSAQGPIGIAAAVAMAEYLARTKTPGSVVVFGCPGEEMMPPNAKTVMYEAGVFDGMDVIVRSHASGATTRPAPGFGTCCMNIDGVKYIFSGAPAHQLQSWNGRNALEAVIHLFVNIDSVRSSLRPEARIQGVITEGGAAPNVVPDRTVADFYIRYPDEVYLRQVRQFVDTAARAAALATGTKVKIDHYGKTRDGISVATLAEVAFAYMKQYGATNVQPEPGRPQGYEETGSVSSAIPGIGFSAHSSNAPGHTYEMEADALAEVGHHGFTVDAQAMTALLFDFATRADYRALVKKEFDGIRQLFGEYLKALERVYTEPVVRDPRD